MPIEHLLDDTHHEGEDQLRYAPSGWRKTIFAFLFLILLPFAGSLPVMLYQRVINGVWFDTWGLLVVGTGLLLITLLVLFELIYSLRAEVEIGEKAVRFTVPQGAVGWMPTVFYRTETVPYADIARVEHVCEVRGGSLAPVLMNCTRLVKHNGDVVLMGTCNEQNPDHTFPYNRIARQIAERVGVEVIDCGHVRQRRKFALMRPGQAIGEPMMLADGEVSAINRRHQAFVWIASTLVAALVAVGVASDLISNGEFGGRAADTPIVQPAR